ncbi:MAG: nuclear transport factor 2 family protein [Selenomonadaceae bacterium]|nr:nuclear transport factor 2 family protein [Selenomonadaceae bacterium]
MEGLQELYREMWRALLSKDIATLERIHAEEFVLTHMTGMKQSREEYFRCVKDSELNYFSETTENVFIDASNEHGTLTGQSLVEAAVFGGRKNTWRLQLVFDVEKRNGKWILIRGKASTY